MPRTRETKDLFPTTERAIAVPPSPQVTFVTARSRTSPQVIFASLILKLNDSGLCGWLRCWKISVPRTQLCENTIQTRVRKSPAENSLLGIRSDWMFVGGKACVV
jgi:hypothetical protein